MHLSIPMSQIIRSDAPLLSPVSSSSDYDSPPPFESFPYSYSLSSPPSPTEPIDPAKMLKGCVSSTSFYSTEELCLPTHQVFDLHQALTTSPTPVEQSQQRLSLSITKSQASPEPPIKRAATPPATVAKKPRASGDRINSKDFVPPDVSGLSKREARLVKNRAAAFLSRQRKREEFETMEIRVGELEEENARLLALTKNAAGAPDQPIDKVLSEMEQLRAQLAAAQERERELSAKIAGNSMQCSDFIKSEFRDVPMPPSPPRSNPPLKSSASLGLMVLLCALPSLLSMPTNNTMSSSFASNFQSAAPVSSRGFDFSSFIANNDYDWTRNSLMDLDVDDQGKVAVAATSSRFSQKLEFADIPSSLQELHGLTGLDISFDASSAENGKIRVRIHPPQSPSSSRASSVIGDSISSSSSASSLGNWQEDLPEPTFATDSYGISSFSQITDPFFGVGDDNADFSLSSMSYGSPMEGELSGDYDSPNAGTDNDFGLSDSLSTTSSSTGCANKRRVRVTLKSLPSTDGEGGEWEVQFC